METYQQFELSPAERELLAGFVREINVLCLAGAWCGDCARQCPIFEHFACACSQVRLRFVDRDADMSLANDLRICGGSRVPVVVFLSEDFFECARYGDRTLSRYRHAATEQLGVAHTTGVNTPHLRLADVADDWLREFERVQLMLRLSPRLRRKHGD